MEKYLLDQEEYGKRLQEKIQAEQRDLRMCEFGKYIEFLPPGVDLGTIAEEEHAKLLLYAKAQWNEREAEQNRIENERIEREQREAAEREAMRAENERLRKEAEKVEAERQKEREAAAKILRACMKDYQFATESAVEKCERAAQKILEAIKILQS
jgi:hypothetical protein